MMSKKKILLIGANGYIGSRFHDKYNTKYDIYGVDSILRSSHKHANKFDISDYRDLDSRFLSQFTDCLWLAGHSSVPQSLSDPAGCFQNNLVELVSFQKRFTGRLIYASSGSVYNSTDGSICDENAILGSPLNMYDFTKVSFDKYLNLMPAEESNPWIGLRFGTVVGASKKIRTELLLNKMVLDSINNKKINLANPYVLRPILFLDDLVRALDTLVSDTTVSNEIFNLCSITASMSEYAKHVSSYFDVPINNLPSSATYNFGMSSKKFISKYNFEFTSNVSDIISNIEDWYVGGYSLA